MIIIITHASLRNWRNFREVSVDLGQRIFVVGPNASGKSNFLDVFRFLHDIAKQEGGGLQKAISQRGGVSKIRCLAARNQPEIKIEVHLSESIDSEPRWKYILEIIQETRGHRHIRVNKEEVYKNGELILQRPDKYDKKDDLRLTQTHLEQINANASFREIADFFNSISYLHLVPQLLRHPESFPVVGIPEDPFGRSFLEQVARTSEKTRKSRLKKIESALRIAVPQLKQLTDTKDETGVPHLEAVYEHWRPHAGKQQEDQFSDGTLRLIGLLWSLLESDSLLLLEEPELSLNGSIVSQLPAVFSKVQSRKKRQLILSTHSVDLLSDKGIGGEEILLLTPSSEGTTITVSSSIEEVRLLLENGVSPADAILSRIHPNNIEELSLF
ncbi:MAG: ATP-binding protein [Syntrophomonadaceae bacterium]|nr:ATP-binding protein [Syntrophomonadaceae bacterium]MDD3897383.1 ATP-binding protein [Syntrophomonadaceae bacterium]MDD4561658.1 ATP-binding protein [Syntrophomonadaceae bacterium]